MGIERRTGLSNPLNRRAWRAVIYDSLRNYKKWAHHRNEVARVIKVSRLDQQRARKSHKAVTVSDLHQIRLDLMEGKAE